MAQGEADHGCAQGEPCRPGHHDPPVPRQRGAEPMLPAMPEPTPGPGCCSDLPGWAGAHRHGPVRPRSRTGRQERPPRRWC